MQYYQRFPVLLTLCTDPIVKIKKYRKGNEKDKRTPAGGLEARRNERRRVELPAWVEQASTEYETVALPLCYGSI